VLDESTGLAIEHAVACWLGAGEQDVPCFIDGDEVVGLMVDGVLGGMLAGRNGFVSVGQLKKLKPF